MKNKLVKFLLLVGLFFVSVAVVIVGVIDKKQDREKADQLAKAREAKKQKAESEKDNIIKKYENEEKGTSDQVEGTAEENS